MARLVSLNEMDSTLLTLELMENVVSWANFDDVKKIKSALRLAAELHVSDFRKSPRSKSPRPPYIEHVLRVTLRLVNDFHITNTDLVISALLHDTVEDHAKDYFNENYPEEEAREKLLHVYHNEYGENVARIVSAVTNPILDKSLSKEEKRESYVNHVRDSVSSNELAFLVKVSDFIDNAGSLHLINKNESKDSNTKYLLSRYTPLVDFFISHANNNLQDETKQEVVRLLKEVSHNLDTLRA